MSEWVLAEELTLRDVQEHPVWEFISDEGVSPDTAVRPVPNHPVRDLKGRLLGTQVRLRNGTYHWAILSNISLDSLRETRHFLCVSIEKNGRWFHLARYHDVDYEERGPAGLAGFLGLSISEILPIEYDISALAVGDPSVLKGTIPREPEERLSLDELVRMCL